LRNSLPVGSAPCTIEGKNKSRTTAADGMDGVHRTDNKIYTDISKRQFGRTNNRIGSEHPSELTCSVEEIQRLLLQTNDEMQTTRNKKLSRNLRMETHKKLPTDYNCSFTAAPLTFIIVGVCGNLDDGPGFQHENMRFFSGLSGPCFVERGFP
jgi:hypothetical protein